MKQPALELLGYCVGLLGFTTPLKVGRQTHAGHSNNRSCPLHECGVGYVHTTVAAPLVQIGVVALDYRPSRPGCAPVASGKYTPLGPVRVVASMG